MKCTKCQGEWTPPANQSLGKCPYCQADILQMLNEQAEELSPKVILANMLQAYSTDLLQNQQRLTAMISDLFAHDHKTKRLLLLSVRENIPIQLLAIQQKDTAEQNTHLLALQHRLAEEVFLKEEVAVQIVSIWAKALYDLFEEPDNSFEIVWKGGYCGFKRKNGTMITPFCYDYALNFNEGLAKVSLKGKCGFIDKNGLEVIPLIFDNAASFYEGLSRIYISGEGEGYIDKNGKVIIPCKYDFATNFNEGLAAVGKNGEWLFIDKNDDIVISCGRESTSGFKDGCAMLESMEVSSITYIDKQINIINKSHYDSGSDFSEDLAMVGRKISPFKFKYGYIDKNGNEKIPLIFDNATSFNNGVAFVKYREKWKIIDYNGNQITNVDYDDYTYDKFTVHSKKCVFEGGLDIVKLNSKFGVINTHGKIIVPIKYEYIDRFSEGLAVVVLDNKYGYIDKKGDVKIPLRYERAGWFSKGIAMAKYNGKWGAIDYNGNIKIPFIYDVDDDDNFIESNRVDHFKYGYEILKQNNKYGIIESNGNVLVPFMYDTIGHFYNGKAQVGINGLKGSIDKSGNWVNDL